MFRCPNFEGAQMLTIRKSKYIKTLQNDMNSFPNGIDAGAYWQNLLP